MLIELDGLGFRAPVVLVPRITGIYYMRDLPSGSKSMEGSLLPLPAGLLRNEVFQAWGDRDRTEDIASQLARFEPLLSCDTIVDGSNCEGWVHVGFKLSGDYRIYHGVVTWAPRRG